MGANGEITVPADGSPVQVRVSVLDDAVTEGDEIVTLTATSANALVTNGTDGDSATGTITDDHGGDNPDRDEDTTANLVVTGGATAVEADGNYLTYSVQLDQPVGDDVTAVLSLGSDAANEADVRQRLQQPGIPKTPPVSGWPWAPTVKSPCPPTAVPSKCALASWTTPSPKATRSSP